MSGPRRLGSRPSASAAERSEAYYRKVADQLIEQIERGTARWTQAWQPGEKGMPRNVVSGKAYRGGNSVWLASVADQRGYLDERWGTYKQVQGLGGQVRRGEKGSAILFWQFETRKLARDRNGRPVQDEEGQPVYETVPLERPRSYPYTVFNAEQCDGLPRREPRAGAHAWDSIEEAESVLKESGASIENAGKNRAYYDLRRDRIILPYKEQFPNGPAYYQTALHELGHWTGHPDRLNRAISYEGHRRGLRVTALRPGGAAGGNQLDDDRGPAPAGPRPVAARRVRRLVDPGAARRPPRDLPGLAGRAGDERLRAGPVAGERAAARHRAGCRAGAGSGPGDAGTGAAPARAARIPQALPQAGGGAEPLARPHDDRGADHPCRMCRGDRPTAPPRPRFDPSAQALDFRGCTVYGKWCAAHRHLRSSVVTLRPSVGPQS